MAATIHYDGDCPFCKRYVELLRLREAVGEVTLQDLRAHPEERHRLAREGYDLDQGMVLELNGRAYAGADAVHMLSLMSGPSDTFNRLIRTLTSSPLGARLLYPLLRCGRNAALLILGRTPLHAVEAGNTALATLFGMAWGLFAFLHTLVYAFQFQAEMRPTTWAIAPLGLTLICWPRSRRVFLILLLCMLVDAWLQLPSHSNHTILKNVYLHALTFAGLWGLVRGGRWHTFLNDAAPVGRFALVCMYLFGVFHKLNSDFFNPEVSCALALWREMPLFLSWVSHPWFDQAAMYGTLIIETVILACLLMPRTRHLGIILGIGFHALLAMSDYALYATFSTLTIALHLLFLDGASAQKIVESPQSQRLQRWMRTPVGLLTGTLWLSLVVLAAWNVSYGAVGVLWLPLVAALCYAIAATGPSGTPLQGGLLWSRLWPLNALSALFLAACFSPYLGLKTAQSMNMFANLQLEGGASNHLVFRDPPGPFHYLEDVVEITHASGSSYLNMIRQSDLHVVYYDLLDTLDRKPGAVVSYRRAGLLYQNQSAATLVRDIDSYLHPRWVRGWFHFNPVDLTTPKLCALDR